MKMRRPTVPFQWSNVPKMLILVAVITTVVIVFGIAVPGMFGSQSLTFPILCIFAGIWWLCVYLVGRRPYPDEPPTAAEQETPQDRAAREFAEAQPTVQDYEQIAASIRARRNERGPDSFQEILEEEEQELPQSRPKKPLGPDHHYDETV